ncbi:aminotransferase class V-fold PLP-dependent enzyme [Solwaraspora sp. WMMA2065]|uniref:DegT/DnrJ/EryC1/StrS family aminotransferase n=1 Tax=Solwaraspora sp. WMMA2065 TaxID=3015166 RepID=UPI00259B0EE4|nr:aminotransferase class V-fold PLP-dependent enzyme [Solwaraspora sp. WMMA2065]WJK37228.1 aminotransferase class V-fold PLP-dependent enzyme [Solwaraspora sp. WMMA2065]
MLPYGRPCLDESDAEAVAAAVRTEWLTAGPTVRRFESELGGYLGGVGCVSVSSGTAALHTAYAAVGLRPGDEVITTPLTFVATAATAALHGARVVFADVEEATGNLDPAAVQAAVTSRTRVVTAVDYAGHPAEYGQLRKVVADAGALLFDDAAHAIGSTYRGVPVGALADLTTFSFFSTKNLTTGEGGAVTGTDPDLLDRVRRFANHGMVRDPDRLRRRDEGGWHQEVHSFGLNYRLSDVLCGLGLNQLTRLPRFKVDRARLAARYHEQLADLPGLRLPEQRPWVDPVWHLYPVRVLADRRREVYDRMRAAGIGVQVNYLPVYRHPVFTDLGYRQGECPTAEAYYAEELSLPIHPDLTDADQDRVVDALWTILG